MPEDLHHFFPPNITTTITTATTLRHIPIKSKGERARGDGGYDFKSPPLSPLLPFQGTSAPLCTITFLLRPPSLLVPPSFFSGSAPESLSLPHTCSRAAGKTPAMAVTSAHTLTFHVFSVSIQAIIWIAKLEHAGLPLACKKCANTCTAFAFTVHTKCPKNLFLQTGALSFFSPFPRLA